MGDGRTNAYKVRCTESEGQLWKLKGDAGYLRIPYKKMLPTLICIPEQTLLKCDSIIKTFSHNPELKKFTYDYVLR